MTYKAVKNFIGVISMRKGDVKEINDANAVKDLLRLGLIEPVKTGATSEADEPEKEKREPVKRGRKPRA